MTCDHNIINNTLHTGEKFILVYHDETNYIMATLTSNQTTSAHQMEEFDTAQDLVDQADIYGITIPPEFYKKYL